MKFALVDSRIGYEFEASLTGLGYRVIKLPPSKALPAPLASHPDMLLHFNGKEIITNKAYYEENRELFDTVSKGGSIKLTLTDECPADTYPRDAIFNALRLGDKLVVRRASVSEAVLRAADEEGLSIINTNQGYPACTTLALNGTHIITADRGIASTLRGCGIEVTLIERGGISLPPYEYGFIGGASGVDDGCVYFFGDIRTHESYDAIIRAIKGIGLRAVSLGGGTLIDLGGIVFIKSNA